jgi:hypothetical protein
MRTLMGKRGCVIVCVGEKGEYGNPVWINKQIVERVRMCLCVIEMVCRYVH